MLTDEEVRALLTVAMGYDNRRPGELNVAAWQTASERGRWTLGEAVEAIHQHYARSREFCMPADVGDWIRAKRRHEPRPGELQLPQAPPAEPERVRAVVAAVARRLGWPERTTTVDDPELKHRCPHEPCSAGINRPCGRRIAHGPHVGEFRPISGYHDSRTKAARAAAERTQEAS